MSAVLPGFSHSLRAALRRDRIRIAAWLLGIAVFVLYCTQALLFAVPKTSDLKAMATLMEGSAGAAMVGPGYGFANPTHGSVFAGAYGLYVILLAACMSILLAVHLTRHEEEAGRQELLQALPVSRHTGIAAATAVLLIANLAATLLTWGVTVLVFAPVSSLLFACGVGLTGLVFGVAALVCAQLVEHARTATGLGFLMLGVAFVVRGVGDVIGQTSTGDERGSLLSWLSPLGWAQQTQAFVADRWWPLSLSLVLAAGFVAVAAALQSRRDLGAGLLPSRSGAARGGSLLRGPLGLAVRMQRSNIIGWAIAATLMGVSFAALAKQVNESLGNLRDPLVVAALGGDATRLVDGYLAECLLFNVILVVCFAIIQVQRMGAEEREGRTELLLSQPLGRVRLAASTLAVTLAGSAIILAVSGLATGLAASATLSDNSYIGALTAASLAFFPAVALCIGVAYLGYAIHNTLAPVAWVVVGASAFLSMLAGPLKLPNWVLQLSVFHATGQPPLENVHVWPTILLAAIAVALIGAGLARFRQRDI